MSGLIEALRVVRQVEGIAFVDFDDTDVVRHKLVQQIVKAYAAYDGDAAPARSPSPPSSSTACRRSRPVACLPAACSGHRREEHGHTVSRPGCVARTGGPGARRG